MAAPETAFSVELVVSRFSRTAARCTGGDDGRHANQAANAARRQSKTTAGISHLRGEAFGLATAVTAGELVCPLSISRLRRFRSALSSAADWQRVSGSFSSALSMIA